MKSIPSSPTLLRRQLAMKSFMEPIRDELNQVESRLRAQVDAFDPGLTGYVEYAAESSGKRLRPALVLIAGGATGGVRDPQIDLAVVIELIHLASLIHDDVLDNALLRRARPTVNAKWGTEISVLLGDCLFAHALKICTRFDDSSVARAVADAANEVCTGEILQTQRRYDFKLTVPEYLRIISMKTAALFRVSTELAATLNQATPTVTQALRTYGESIGIAYQIYDDCLDLFGREEGFGKTLGTDLKKGKLTLPVLHLLAQLDPQELETVAESIVHGNEADHAALVTRVAEAGGQKYSARKALELLEKAEKAVEVLPPSRYAAVLRDFSRSFQQELSALR